MFNNKFKKYKKVYFIDCENVGFELPFPIDKNAYYYYFCNNNAKIDFNSVNTLMNHRNIGLYTHTASKQKKNSLDFCIVVELTKMVLKYKENKYMVQKAKKCIPDFAELLHNKSIKQKYPRRNGRWGRKKKEVIRTACLQANFLHGNQGTWLSAAT